MRTHILVILSILFVSGIMSYAQDYVGPEKCLSCHNNAGLGDMTWLENFNACQWLYCSS